jgi:hypothetical protein
MASKPTMLMVTTAKGESRDRACTGMTEPQQLVLEEHSLSASRRFALNKAKHLERGVPSGTSLFLFRCLV